MSAPFIYRVSRRLLPSALLVATPVAATYYYYSNQNKNQSPSIFKSPSNLLTISIPISHADSQQHQKQEQKSSIFKTLENHSAGSINPKLPAITASEVRSTKCNSSPAPIYVTFRDGVYDISSFSESHPGGDLILLAAGGPLEAYWSMYPQHASPFVLDLLEELRVGNFKIDDQWIKDHHQSNEKSSSGYEKDPTRHPAMIVQSMAPYTAETPPHALVSSHYTPNELFYVRNHMPVPVIKGEEYELKITDKNGKQLESLTLNDLKTKFEKVDVSATVQCAGNRRNELGRVKKVKGGGWEIGAISNAQWTGVKLSDVLTHAHKGNSKEFFINEHICFAGLDKDPVTGVVYEASIPMDILRRHSDHIILAYEMNGEELPRDHGYPIRIVIPGIVGARHVKWVSDVRLSDKESESHWQQKDYRSFSPDIDWNNVNFKKSPSIQEMPVVSAICTHSIDYNDNIINMKGYAWSGDGKEIIRVDVSVDGGKSWTGATFNDDDDAEMKGRRNEIYDWKIWSASVDLPKDGTNVQLVCKAIDSAYNSQPDGAESIWNLRGLLNNCWHRVDVMLSTSRGKVEKDGEDEEDEKTAFIKDAAA